MDYSQDGAKRDRFKEIGDALFKERMAKPAVVKPAPRVFPARGLRRDFTPSALL